MKQATKVVISQQFSGVSVDSTLVRDLDDVLSSLSWSLSGEKAQLDRLMTLKANTKQRQAYESIASKLP